MRHIFAIALIAVLLTVSPAHAEDIGCVSTDIRMLGLANDKICVASFADPKVPGVACYISRAQTGGAKGAIGVAEDPSEAAISCHQVGPITLDKNLKDGEKVFEESRSFWFKTLQVVRFFDKANNTLVYLSYSDKLIDGSPKNSVSAIPVMPWPTK
jgi:CreA protein